jgi:ABC-type branched-subunit amino acid transport system permease subunit
VRLTAFVISGLVAGAMGYLTAAQNGSSPCSTTGA